MQPRNKLQKDVLRCSQNLAPLTAKEWGEAMNKMGLHLAKHDSKGNYTCLECGHQWKGKRDDKVVCPHCGTHLSVDISRKKKFKGKYYFSTITTVENYQVVRIYFFYNFCKKGAKAHYWNCEIFQRWFTPEGKEIIVGKRRHYMGWYVDRWDFLSDMEIRTENDAHRVEPWVVVGTPKFTAQLKRNGLKQSLHDCNPQSIIRALLNNNQCETLWKAKRFDLVQYGLKTRFGSFNTYWNSIKIALRNHYKIKDVSMWFDLLRCLEYFGKDLRNAKYVCPPDLQAAHDYWAKKRADREERERFERERQASIEKLKREKEQVENFNKFIQKFLNLILVDNEISVKPLLTIDEFIEEGAKMKHCVFGMGYYGKKDTLILHALRDNESIATIELNLKTMQIIQCRGKCNQVPEHNERIQALINSNIGKIAKCMAA